MDQEPKDKIIRVASEATGTEPGRWSVKSEPFAVRITYTVECPSRWRPLDSYKVESSFTVHHLTWDRVVKLAQATAKAVREFIEETQP